MKRVIAVILVLVMIPAACFASVNLDTTKRIMEYAVSRMKSMVTVYDLHPDYFDDDVAYMAYSYYELYIASKRAYSAELLFSVKEIAGLKNVVIDDATKLTESSSATFYGLVDSMYYKWLDGEKTTKQFADFIIIVIKSAIEAKDTAEKDTGAK